MKDLFHSDEQRLRQTIGKESALPDLIIPTVHSHYNQYAPDEQREGLPDVDDLLLRERIIFIGKVIDSDLAHRVIALLLYLQSEDPSSDITIYIDSPGGSVSAGLAIYDTMQFVKPDVATVCVGMAMSMGAFLLAAGAPGKRYSLPHSTILIHQPLIPSTFYGVASDIDIEAREIIRMRSMLNELLAQHTGQPLERIIADTDRDHYFSAQEALEYGLIDHVMTARKLRQLSE
jgi:ATP-dependent Clp protease protease subunit